LDVMEARSATILHPRLSVTRRSPMLFVRRVLRIASKYAVPVQILQALRRPEAVRARVERIGRELTSRLGLSSTATIAERLDFARRVLETECISQAPKTMPTAAAGLGMLGVASK